GRNADIIKQIADEATTVEGVSLLDVDPGKATNRTVITFVGNPENVIEAAYRLIKKAAELIDMRNHKGEHPRMGATDVCPLIPVSGITLEETAEYAKKLGKRVGEELGIPVYLYEKAASADYRSNLADIRSGEYEGIAAKIGIPEWKPDYGLAVFNETAGMAGIGVRYFVIGSNFCWIYTDYRRAIDVAFDLRDLGRTKKGRKCHLMKHANGEVL